MEMYTGVLPNKWHLQKPNNKKLATQKANIISSHILVCSLHLTEIKTMWHQITQFVFLKDVIRRNVISIKRCQQMKHIPSGFAREDVLSDSIQSEEVAKHIRTPYIHLFDMYFSSMPPIKITIFVGCLKSLQIKE